MWIWSRQEHLFKCYVNLTEIVDAFLTWTCNKHWPCPFWVWRPPPPPPPRPSLLPPPTWTAPPDLHSSTGSFRMYRHHSLSCACLRLFSPAWTLSSWMPELPAVLAWIDDDFSGDLQRCVRKRNYRFGDHSKIRTGVIIRYPTGEVLSDESKCYQSNRSREWGKHPEDIGCLPLGFGSEPGWNQSWQLWLIPPDRWPQWFITCRIYFNSYAEFWAIFPHKWCYFRNKVRRYSMLLFESIWRMTKPLLAWPDFHFLFLILQHVMNDCMQQADTNQDNRDTAAGMGASPHSTSSNLQRTFLRGSKKCTLVNAVRS